ncbi:type II secretion system F family protein [Kamptonema cortianum]|nr:type II secretion system F family protein [Geitlerinema splendidum]MDK3161171.1 type II secretion system F family protein [Kamptonema cortianum]
MQNFQYQGFDQTGASQSGTVEAENANEAVKKLAARGLIIQSVVPVNSAIRSPVENPISQASKIPPVQTTRPESATSVRINSVIKGNNQAKLMPIYTGLFRDSDLFILTSQMASVLRSGISPHEMCRHLSQRASLTPQAREAMSKLANLTAEGRPLSEAMTAYPDIFPPGLIGAVRAGEEGGYLPLAIENSSLQIQESSKLRKQGKFVIAAFWSVVLCLPVLGIFLPAVDMMLKRMFRDGATTGGLETLGHGTLSALLGPAGIIFVAMILIWIFSPWLFGRTNLLPLRHKLAATIPPISSFVGFESSQVFAFHVERLSSAGIAPYNAWQLAVEAIPNVEIQSRLRHVGHPNETTKISDLLHQTKVFPYEMIQMVETGEYTGSVPNAMQQVRAMTEAEAKRTLGLIKVKFWLWIGLSVFCGNCLIMAIFYRGFYDSVFRHVLEQ